jgi:hypothetical protein
MPQCTVVDTFPTFLAVWQRVQEESSDAQIEHWLNDYMVHWPELLEKQQKDYAEQGVDWRVIARERIFPFLSERLPAMAKAHRSLLTCLQPAYRTAQKALGVDFDVVCVIHVGIGMGAWATAYEGKRACLFGLENMAELGWTGKEELTGVMHHELSHLLHAEWREKAGQPGGTGPFWDLYEEGFARRCEQGIVGKPVTHEHSPEEMAWLRENRAWLAGEFLRAVGAGEPVNRFFGSWYEIRGKRQTGYFLGHEVIREWERTMGLKEMGVLPSDMVDRRVHETLRSFAP